MWLVCQGCSSSSLAARWASAISLGQWASGSLLLFAISCHRLQLMATVSTGGYWDPSPKEGRLPTGYYSQLSSTIEAPFRLRGWNIRQSVSRAQERSAPIPRVSCHPGTETSVPFHSSVVPWMLDCYFLKWYNSYLRFDYNMKDQNRKPEAFWLISF